MYGHVPGDIDQLAGKLDDTAVVVDMAQGILLAGAMPLLMQRADAVVYSFGIGKGLDTGGGLLALRRRSDDLALGTPTRDLLGSVAGVMQALALQTVVRLGVYRYLLPLFEREIENEKTDVPSDIGGQHPVLARSIFASWAARLPTMAREIALARGRASLIFAQPTVQRHCRDAPLYASPKACHLRQIVRLIDASRRDALLAGLRSDGIDVMPAGEPLPEDYLGPQIACDGTGFPNARRFRADSIRLPYLGRLDERSFTSLLSSLEARLGERLPV